MRRPEWLEKLRRWLIYKLGGFVLLQEEHRHIIIRSTTVEPRELKVQAFFGQKDLYDITPYDLEHAARSRLYDKLGQQIRSDDWIEILTTQDPDDGGLTLSASMWVVPAKEMRRALKG